MLAGLPEGFLNEENCFGSQYLEDRALSFIEGLYNPAFEVEMVMNIIYEETESFFQGQKSAEDVAGLIQNRVQLYLHERM